MYAVTGAVAATFKLRHWPSAPGHAHTNEDELSPVVAPNLPPDVTFSPVIFPIMSVEEESATKGAHAIRE